jgi:hypothetical protein
MTLPEVLVAGAILAGFMVMAGNVVVQAYHNQVRMSHKHAAMRQTAVGLDLMARELRLSKLVIRPTIGFWGFDVPYEPSFANGPFVFVRNSPIGDVAAVYWYDRGELRRTLAMYSPGFNPNSPGSWVLVPGETLDGRRIGYSIKKLEVTHATFPNHRTVQAKAWVADVSEPITVQAQVLSL